jgi:hypothetical protein
VVIKGSCLCGAVSYEITGSFIAAGNCPLSHVQEVSWGGICDVGVHQPGPVPVDIRRGICPGVPILSRTREMLLQEVRLPACCCTFRQDLGGGVGTVDGDPGVRPREHIFVGSKAPWYEIADALPQFEEWPTRMEPDG